MHQGVAATSRKKSFALIAATQQNINVSSDFCALKIGIARSNAGFFCVCYLCTYMKACNRTSQMSSLEKSTLNAPSTSSRLPTM